AGLAAMELARGDGSIYTFFGATSGFAINTIFNLGSEDQKEKWIPGMARLEKLGAFALTEPEHGSDAVMIETKARREGDEYVIDGKINDTTSALAVVRCGVAWEALGHAIAVYETTLAHTRERKQFGKPISSFQLVQDKLAKMLADITTMFLLCIQLGRRAEAGKMTDVAPSLAKMNNAQKARRICLD